MLTNVIAFAALTVATLTGTPHTYPPVADIPTVIDVHQSSSTQTPAHEPWPLGMTCQHNTAGGPQGWVCTEPGIQNGHECVIHVSVEPYRAIVVRDSSVLCETEAVTPGTLARRFAEDKEDRFGGTPGGAVCGTDAQCADWSRAHGEEPSGYAAGK